MKTYGIIFSFLFVFNWCYTQQLETLKAVDSLYKEDHYYISITYNVLGSIPSGISQTGFSYGFHMGYIKDMPINTRRNKAFGIGLGYSHNSYNQNLLIVKDEVGGVNFSVLDDKDAYSRNKFSSHVIEVPFEFRWRTSTPSEYQFWRIYTGFKLGYVFANAAKYKGDLGDFKYNGIDDFNDFQYGLTLSAGYNTWNLFLYYPLNAIFSQSADINDETIDMNSIKIGLIFYIL